MKILHIFLREYDTYKELEADFYNMDKGMNQHGIQLASSKKQAEKNLIYQHKHFGEKGARVFWWSKGEYQGINTFAIHEAVFD
jgi:hypothetical protein